MPAHIKYPVLFGYKKCGSCGEWKPVDNFKKSRNHYTSRCRPCLRNHYAEYRNKPEVKIASAKYHREYMQNPKNRERSNNNARKYRKKPEAKERKNRNRRNWSLREKQKAVDYKGGQCEICGYSRCTAALDFHHADPSTKNGYAWGALKSHWTFERNKAEIDKCHLVCVRCHREIHAGLHPQFLKGGA